MRRLLETLQQAYGCPVDVEFTANFPDPPRYKINLLQCRPLQVKEGLPIREPPKDVRAKDVLLEARGAVIGQSRVASIDRCIYVVPHAYADLPIGERYALARLIGRLVHLPVSGEAPTIMLLGPGRWGTTTPSLGVPVSFADINAAGVLCEIVAMKENLAPDVSLGTHFLNELIEMDILYLALFPGQEGNRLNETLLEAMPNRLADLLPDAASWAHAVRVLDATGLPGGAVLTLSADTLKQRVLCYLARTARPQAPVRPRS
jgi:hypothetical protein